MKIQLVDDYRPNTHMVLDRGISPYEVSRTYCYPNVETEAWTMLQDEYTFQRYMKVMAAKPPDVNEFTDGRIGWDTFAERVRKIAVAQDVVDNNTLSLAHIHQRTPEWFAFRKTTMTTASSCKEYVERINANKEEVTRLFKPTAATTHGTYFEIVVKYLFCMMSGSTILDVGCMRDSEFLMTASPDGIITTSGSLVEIKSPYSDFVRVCKPIYYFQVQAQMAVTGIHHTMFVSADVCEYLGHTDFMTDVDAEHPEMTRDKKLRGVALYVFGADGEHIIHEECMGIDMTCDAIIDEMRGRYSKLRERFGGIGKILVKYWKIRDWFLQSIDFDEEFYNTNIKDCLSKKKLSMTTTS